MDGYYFIIKFVSSKSILVYVATLISGGQIIAQQTSTCKLLNQVRSSPVVLTDKMRQTNYHSEN
jgi:hypothetical protein